MKNLHLVAVVASIFLAAPAFAQTRLNSVGGGGPTFAYPGMTYTTPNGGVIYNGTTGYPGYSPYGYGYGNAFGYPGYGYPAYRYGVPTVLSNGLFSIGFGNQAVNMWRAPSGYYYPWYGVPSGYNTTTVLYAPNATSAPTPQQPPISTTVSDMLKFIDQAHEKRQIPDGDYEHLRRRVIDIQSKYRDLFSQTNGTLDPQDEQSIRNDLNSVGMEITERVKPQ